MNVTDSLNGSDAFIKEDAPWLERVIEASILTFFCVLALTGNILLWIIILRDKSLREPSNMLILCLSTADILVSAVNMPVIVFTLIHGSWAFNDAACTGLGFITMLTFVGSVMSLGTISINRYIHICQHARFSTTYTWRNTAFFFMGTWVLSVLLSIPPLLGWAKYDYIPGQSFCFCDWNTSISYTFFMVGTCFGGPCSVMTFCYVNILRKVRRSKRRIQAFAHQATPASPSQISNTSFSDSSNQRPSSTYTKSSLLSLTRKRKGDSVGRKNSVTESTKGQRPISIRSQDDIDEHFPSRGYMKSTESVNGRTPSQDTGSVPSSDVNILSQYSNVIHVSSKPGEDNSSPYNPLNGQKSELSTDTDENCTASVNLHDKSKSSYDERTPFAGYDKLDNDHVTHTKLSHSNINTTSNHTTDTLNTPIISLRSPSGTSEILTVSSAVQPHLLQPPPGSRHRVAEEVRKTKRQTQAARRRQDELRMTMSLLVVISVFVVCWLPFCITMFWYVFAPRPVPRILNMATLLLGCMNSACNPIIYGLMNRKFKRGFARLCCSCRLKWPNSNSESSQGN